MKKLFCVFIFGILSFSTGDLFAQDEPFIRISDVPSQNPLWLSNENWIDKIDVTYHAPNNELFVLYDNQIYKFDFEQRLWTEYASVDLPDDVIHFEFSEVHNGFLFWDRGVGRVFLLDSNKQLTRIDNSFQHRNQYFHGPWIDQKTGNIYAFGGYGLFTAKSIITKFETESGEWQLQSVASPNTIPSPQIGMYIVPDMSNDRIFMIGNRSFHKDVVPTSDNFIQERAIWEFNIKSVTWSKLVDVPAPDVSGGLSKTYPSAHPNLDFILFKSEDEIEKDFIEAYHVPSNKLKSLTDLNANFKLPHPIINIIWSDTDQLFYVLMANILDTQNAIQLSVKKIEILDEATFIGWLSASDRNYNLLIAGLLVVVASLTIFRVRKAKQHSGSQTEPTWGTKILVSFNKNGEFIELKYQETVINAIPVMEQKLLELLLQNYSSPNKYTASDDVDVHLLPDHPSLDYIRRNRNLTLERLESLFQSLNNLNDEKYILRGVNQFDKRKSEYRLNDLYIEVVIATNE